ncbi:hypothetical protein VKT23_015885 [Stygiomarasmius scandens]|uniref:Enoyl reductase (ER) domain-containing protein n=1 Tax=Marasmiellus scandens TaxID=2682957 RepID=A0ABR1IXT2_9AGAR
MTAPRAITSIPCFMKALVTTGDGHFKMKTTPVPVVETTSVLIKVECAAQNPTDWKTVALHREAGNIIGCDFSGTVVQIGSDVKAGKRFIGERVAGCVHGGIGKNGAFAEYLVASADLVISLPDSWSFEDGAQLGIATMTTCQCLYQYLSLPSPLDPSIDDHSTPLLVWSGSSSTGQYVIQFAKIAGLEIFSTSSPRNFSLLKSLGAKEVFDYSDSKTCKRVFSASRGKLKIAVDCASTGMSPAQVSNSLGEAGGRIAFLVPAVSMKKHVETKFILTYTIFGKAIKVPFIHEARPDHYENATRYCEMVSKIIMDFPIKPVPVKLYPHGLASVQEGFDYMKSGKVHAEKLTYRIPDTPGVQDNLGIDNIQDGPP